MCDRPTTQESETKLQSRNGEKPPEQKQPNAWKNPESSAENQPKRSTPKNAESISTQSPKDSASVITKIPSTSDVTLKIQRGSSAVVVEQLPSAVTDDSHSGDDWSMVGSKGKSNRGKTSQKQSILEQSEPTSKSKKKSGKSQSRKRVNQKAVKEMMSTLIETPSLEKQQQHHQQQPQTVIGNTKSLQTIEGTTTPSEDKKDKQPPSLRDIVAGKVSTSRVLPTPSLDTVGTPKKVIPKSSSITATLTPLGSSLASKVSKELAASRRSGQTAVMTKKSLNADQSTAPTLPETLSGVSANTRSHNSSASVPGQPEVSVGNDSNSGDIDMKTKSHSPPLPTLLSGPGNTNSATSSVASSLEHPREQNTSGKETDVGYHLLSVCERLNKDMGTFMTRRRLALDVRRRERGTLLSALQDIAAKIWVGRCRVEMYGSCATQLDLPSSDLDAVICGLPIPKQQKKKKHGDGSDPIDQYHYHGNQSVNGGRVLRLAEELERQPWVVQIKPIPTATVPVIKILADPARVHGSGASNTGSDWRIQQQCANSSNSQIASQTNSFHNSPSHYISSSSSPGQIMQPYPTPWRGADVMNGLIKLDITFEGPEHGGIGSTAYTARVVQDACNETGLPPESTPTVQVTMVLKELLAQRRLNEPFSGGLSSYALLLMVVAIMRERRAIRAEMALAERQRRAVASTNASSMRTISNPSQQPKPVVSRSNSCTSLSSRNAVIPSTCTSVSSVSSWASIAKKSELPQRTHSSDKVPPVQQPIKEKVLTKSNSSSQLPPSHVIKKPVSVGSGPLPSSTFNFAPGSNDVLEVLCSGEETAGKLLMHCLLFYGHYFNAQSMVIDVTAPEYGRGPFTARRQGGLIDPVSGVFTVDPIVVYDPLEGAEGNNVARSCFAWINIRSVFAQCYTTLQHTVERKGRIDYGSSDSPCLLELLLSF